MLKKLSFVQLAISNRNVGQAGLVQASKLCQKQALG